MAISEIEVHSHSNSSSMYLPAIGRLMLAAIFLLSGAGKIFAPGPTQEFIASAGLPLPFVAYVLALIVEVGGGLMLVLGYNTRAVALVLGVFSIATAFGFHHDFADQNQIMHFMKNVAIAGGMFQIVAFGAGDFSLDARRRS
jgi:putative oxidoreductase